MKPHREQRIRKTLESALRPQHLQILDESGNHRVPEDSESHFRLVIVSEQFASQSRIGRHKRVYALLQKELDSGLHALALQTMTPEEWRQSEGLTRQSPDCLGGEKV